MAVMTHPGYVAGAAEVSTDRPGRKVTLSWEGPEEVLAKSTLLDTVTGRRIRPSQVPNGYSFVLDATTRQLVWTVTGRVSLGPV